ncbi:MAG: response regulator [Sphingorhabdus sp.]
MENPDTSNATACNVLVVDNDPLVRLGTVMMLREAGYSARFAQDAKTALAILKEGYAPELMVTDYSMPGMNGVELARSVSALGLGTLILIMTGHSKLEETTDEKWGILAKPFDTNELKTAIAELSH